MVRQDLSHFIIESCLSVHITSTISNSLDKQRERKRQFSSDLQEGEDEADGEVGQPVEAAGHRVGRRPVRLLEQLCGDQEGDAGCDTEKQEGVKNHLF